MKDLISIIIPVYNCEKYIEKCINSVINQTYNNIEIIIIDDGSIDKSPSICDELSVKNNNIKVYHKNNEGVSKARNYGIEKANGKYILFIDGDDYIDKKMISNLYNNLINNEADISMCNVIRVNEDGGYVDKFNNNIDNENPTINIMTKEDFISNILDYKYYFTYATNKLIRKEIIGDIRFRDNIHYNEDGLFFLDLSSNINKAVYIGPVKYYYYVQNGTSANAQKFNEKYATVVDSFEIMEKYFQIFNYRNKCYFSYRYINYCIESYYFSISGKDRNKVNKDYLRQIKKKYFHYALHADNVSIKKKIFFILKSISPTIMMNIKYNVIK